MSRRRKCKDCQSCFQFTTSDKNAYKYCCLTFKREISPENTACFAILDRLDYGNNRFYHVDQRWNNITCTCVNSSKSSPGKKGWHHSLIAAVDGAEFSKEIDPQKVLLMFGRIVPLRGDGIHHFQSYAINISEVLKDE